MGKSDLIEKEYFSNPKHFKELVNSFIYGGKEVVKEDELVSLNTDQVLNGKERLRDLIMAVMKDSHSYYCLVGLENQSRVDYYMPVRCMVYDSNSLIEQNEGSKRKKLFL